MKRFFDRHFSIAQVMLATVSASILFPAAAAAQKASPLAGTPDWRQLERFQETITREDFLKLLTEVYAPNGAAEGTVKIRPDSVAIRKGQAGGQFVLRFAPSTAEAKPIPRYWQPATELPPVSQKEQPLARLHIAIDPGHIGGEWARIEERWFQIGNGEPVTEGDMALRVGNVLSSRLQQLGAKVSMVRGNAEPVTKSRPADLRKLATSELKRLGVRHLRDDYDGPNDPLKSNSIRWQSELLFYRVSEIRARAEKVNEKLKPDLTVCIHFNAESWGDPADPQLVQANHLHLLINGCYSAGELAYDDIRFDMLVKLLNRAFPEEAAVSETVATALAKATGLPPYIYTGGNARRVSGSAYVWARNLLANRLYHSPVIFLEPYVMNSRAVYEHVQLGDYEGLREVNGKLRKNIYREYADAIADGLALHYSLAREE